MHDQGQPQQKVVIAHISYIPYQHPLGFLQLHSHGLPLVFHKVILPYSSSNHLFYHILLHSQGLDLQIKPRLMEGSMV